MTEIVKGRLLEGWGERKAGEVVDVDAVRFAAMVERGEVEIYVEEPVEVAPVVVGAPVRSRRGRRVEE